MEEKVSKNVIQPKELRENIEDALIIEEKRTNRGKKYKNKIKFNMTHAMIKEALFNLSKEGTYPTMSAIASQIGVDIKTVQRHMEQFKFEEVCETYKVLTPNVMRAVYKSAAKGSVPAQRLWLEVVEKFRPGVDIGLAADIKTEITIKFE